MDIVRNSTPPHVWKPVLQLIEKLQYRYSVEFQPAVADVLVELAFLTQNSAYLYCSGTVLLKGWWQKWNPCYPLFQKWNPCFILFSLISYSEFIYLIRVNLIRDFHSNLKTLCANQIFIYYWKSFCQEITENIVNMQGVSMHYGEVAMGRSD